MFHPAYYNLKIIQSIKELKQLAEVLHESKYRYYDTETSGLAVRHPGKVFVAGYTFAVDDNLTEDVFYIPVNHIFEGKYIPRINLEAMKLNPKDFPDFDESILDGEYYNLDPEDTIKILKPIFEDGKGTWVAHNISYDMHVLANEGVNINKFFRKRVLGQATTSIYDTMIACHQVDEEAEKKLETIIEKKYGIKKTDYDDCVATVTAAEKKEVGLKSNNKASFPHTQIPIGGRYSAEDVFFMKAMYEDTIQALEEDGQTETFYKLRLPYVKDLWDMERVGVKVDEKRLDAMTVKAKEELDKMQYELYEIIGAEFNVNSGQQVGEILFGHKKLLKDKNTGGYKESYNKSLVDNSFKFPVVEWTDGGKDKDKKLRNPKTDGAALEEIMKLEPKDEKQSRGKDFVKIMLKYNKLEKLYSSFMIGLKENMYVDGKIHPSYNICGTETRRLSCDSVNLQQLPRPLEGDEDDYDFWIQFEIRSLFIPDNEDEVIIAADYGALEKCLTCEFTGDKALIDMIVNGWDAHGFTSTLIFDECRDLHPNEVKKKYPHLRYISKTVGFALDYGGTEYTVSKNLGISKDQARLYIDKYFEGFSGIAEWGVKQIQFGRKYGFVHTLLGQKRHLHGIHDHNQKISGYYERVCKNAPVQGSASEVASRAQMLLNLNPVIKMLGINIIMQTHDELVLTCKIKFIHLALDKITNIMIHPLPFDLVVPLKVGIDYANNYASAK